MSSSAYPASVEGVLEQPVQPWLWANLLSLDAPIVALLWQALFGRAFSSHLRWPAFVALGSTVWIIYVSDRLLDSRHVLTEISSSRHQFYRQHRWEFVAGLLLVFSVLAEALCFLNRTVLRNGIVTALTVGLYLVIIHANSRAARQWFPKEFAVGVIFAAGTCLATWSKTDVKLGLFAPAACFAALCWLNCAAIDYWENDRLHEQRRAALTSNSLECALLAVAVFSAILTSLASVQGVFASIAFSAILLLAVHRCRPGLSPDARRVLADACLCTPALFIINAHLV